MSMYKCSLHCTDIPNLAYTYKRPYAGFETSGVPNALEHKLSPRGTDLSKTSVPLGLMLFCVTFH